MYMIPQFFSPPRGGILNIFSPSYQNKNAELHKIFTSLPASEKLIDGEGMYTHITSLTVTVRLLH